MTDELGSLFQSRAASGKNECRRVVVRQYAIKYLMSWPRVVVGKLPSRSDLTVIIINGNNSGWRGGGGGEGVELCCPSVPF